MGNVPTNLKMIIIDSKQTERSRLYDELLADHIASENIVFIEKGTSIMKRIGELKPDIVVLETNLFPISRRMGYEICSDIKSNYPNIKVVGMGIGNEFRDKWKDAGADYIADKFELMDDAENLLNIIQKLYGKHA